MRVSFMPLFLSSAMAFAGNLFATADRPNIVVFLTDDQSQRDATPYGAHWLRTPNMQRLADAGLSFERAYVASPTCAPSRAALLTGLMPARNGSEANHSRPQKGLKKWPAYFQELGYEVVAIGKVAHYRQAVDYGFDYFAHDTFHDAEVIPAAVEFLKKRDPRATKPLCLMVGTNWPHVPWPENPAGYEAARLPLPPGSFDTSETRLWHARYAAAVTKADDDLGVIYDLAPKILGERTLFVFSSDNGAQWPFAKWNCYEAGVRVPLIIIWPGVVKPKSRTSAMVSWVDLLPTLLEAVGGRAPAEIDGRSFLAVLRGSVKEHRDRIFATHSGDGRWNIYPMRSLRIGDWKYILNLHPEFAFTTHIDLPGDLGQRAFFSTWEAAAEKDTRAASILKRYHARPGEELYDLVSDPHEQRNLASNPRQAKRMASMRAELDEWMKRQGDRQTVFAEPRLLSDPSSYGPKAPPGNVEPKAKPPARRP